MNGFGIFKIVINIKQRMPHQVLNSGWPYVFNLMIIILTLLIKDIRGNLILARQM